MWGKEVTKYLHAFIFLAPKVSSRQKRPVLSEIASERGKIFRNCGGSGACDKLTCWHFVFCTYCKVSAHSKYRRAKREEISCIKIFKKRHTSTLKFLCTPLAFIGWTAPNLFCLLKLTFKPRKQNDNIHYLYVFYLCNSITQYLSKEHNNDNHKSRHIRFVDDRRCDLVDQTWVAVPQSDALTFY